MICFHFLEVSANFHHQVFSGNIMSLLWCIIHRVKKNVSLVIKVIHDRKMIKWSSSKKYLPLSLFLQIIKILLKNISPLLHLPWASFHFSSGFNFYLKEFVIEKTWSNKRNMYPVKFLRMNLDQLIHILEYLFKPNEI